MRTSTTRWIARAAAVFAGLAAAAAPARSSAQMLDVEPGPSRFGLALDLDGGARYVAAPAAGRGFGFFWRGGLGALWMNEGGFLSATATASRTPVAPSKWTFGLQAETVRISTGIGLSLGANMSTARVVGLHAAPSFSLFHLEAQAFLAETTVWAVALYIRVPVGFIARVLWESKQT